MTDEKKIILIFGKRGSGKSYLAKKMIQAESRLIIFDTLSEYKNGVVFEDYEKFLEAWKVVYTRPHKLIYRPLRPDAEIDQLAELVFAMGQVTFLVEEIDCYCTAFQISDSFAHIIQRGRHKDITLIGITQRPYGINRLLTSMAKEIFIFNTNEPRDRDYFRQLLGNQVDQYIDQLDQYQYVKWSDTAGGQFEIGKA